MAPNAIATEMQALFYIEYRNGKYSEVECSTQRTAEHLYAEYSKRPELTATGWGWELNDPANSLNRQIRQKKLARISAQEAEIG